MLIALFIFKSVFAESFKFFEPSQTLQNIIQQHYSPATLEQISRLADSINRSVGRLLPPNFSEVSKTFSAFQQSDWLRMTELAKNSMGVTSSIPVFRDWEYEEEQLKKSAEKLSEVEVAIEKMPSELQDDFWNLPLEDDFAKATEIVLDPNLTDEQRAAELATFFAGGEIESSWMQIRRILYPHLVSLFVALDTISYVNTNFIGDNDFQKLITVYYVILALIYFLGVPPERSDSES